MKCAILCCLLALCAFQIVHAVTQKDLEKACAIHIAQWQYYSTKKQGEFITAKKCSKKGEEDIDDCDEDFNAQLKEKTPQVENDFGKCTNIKTPHNCVQTATNCCKKNYNSFKIWMDQLTKDKLRCL